jgi:ElaB/YqjD/DUF883 family membrane-anchored ribosome-binding protein
METCEEKHRLTGEHHAAIESYGDAVSKLLNGIGTTAKDDYERLRKRADEFRLYSERMRLALEQHIAEHGC